MGDIGILERKVRQVQDATSHFLQSIDSKPSLSKDEILTVQQTNMSESMQQYAKVVCERTL